MPERFETNPSEYEAAWRYVTLMEQLGEIDPVEAEAWRVGFYERMNGVGAITDDVDLMH